MEENQTYAEDLKIIRTMMENSSKFLSLSGLSGLFAGLFAIAGAGYAWYFILGQRADFSTDHLSQLSINSGNNVGVNLIILASVILVLAISVSYFLSYRKSRLRGNKLWNPIAWRMLINLMIPLVSGAVFILALVIYGSLQFIVPAMLIFYGLALVNAGKYTFGEVHYLGMLQLITGVISCFFPELGLLFWVTGFGFLHVLYGLIMYRKYE